MRSESGDKACKRVYLRIVPPDGHPHIAGVIVAQAAQGRCYTEQQVEEIVERMIERLDQRFPRWEFRMVRIRFDRVNFVYAGLRGE